MESVTIVSCYYKVKSKHPHSKYNEWIYNFLYNLRNNIIIFTSEDLVDYLKEIGKYNTKMIIVIKNFEDIDILKQYDIWDHQSEIDPQQNIRTKECYILWNSKMNFLNEAIQLNPFQSDKFVWTDIGCLRDQRYCNYIMNYPLYKNISDDKLDIVLINPFVNESQLVFQNEVHLAGAIFGSSKKTLQKIIPLYYYYFNEYVKNNLFIGCDQQILSTLFTQHKDLFNLIIPNQNCIDEWFYLWFYYLKV
jgi:hypothetical protein